MIKFMLHSLDLEPVIAMQDTLLTALIGLVRGKCTESQVSVVTAQVRGWDRLAFHASSEFAHCTSSAGSQG